MVMVHHVLTADITFGAFDAAAGTAEVLYDFGSPVAGFQFDVVGLTVTGASGGAAGDAGMTVIIGGNTVLVFLLPILSLQLVQVF